MSGGNTLYEARKQPLGTPGGELCEGFTLGYVSGLSQMHANGDSFDSPDGVSGEQLTDIAIKSLANHSETRQKPATALIWNAIREAFPLQTVITPSPPGAANEAGYEQGALSQPTTRSAD